MKNTTSKQTNAAADKMLAGINTVIQESLKTTPRLTGAIIDRVNEDGTVNVYFPPDRDQIFTNISNQTPFQLNKGDSVELLIKNGDYSNCWVAAKHEESYDIERIIREQVIAVLQDYNLIPS